MENSQTETNTSRRAFLELLHSPTPSKSPSNRTRIDNDDSFSNYSPGKRANSSPKRNLSDQKDANTPDAEQLHNMRANKRIIEASSSEEESPTKKIKKGPIVKSVSPKGTPPSRHESDSDDLFEDLLDDVESVEEQEEFQQLEDSQKLFEVEQKWYTPKSKTQQTAGTIQHYFKPKEDATTNKSPSIPFTKTVPQVKKVEPNKIERTSSSLIKKLESEHLPRKLSIKANSKPNIKPSPTLKVDHPVKTPDKNPTETPKSKTTKAAIAVSDEENDSDNPFTRAKRKNVPKKDVSSPFLSPSSAEKEDDVNLANVSGNEWVTPKKKKSPTSTTTITPSPMTTPITSTHKPISNPTTKGKVQDKSKEKVQKKLQAETIDSDDEFDVVNVDPIHETRTSMPKKVDEPWWKNQDPNELDAKEDIKNLTSLAEERARRRAERLAEEEEERAKAKKLQEVQRMKQNIQKAKGKTPNRRLSNGQTTITSHYPSKIIPEKEDSGGEHVSGEEDTKKSPKAPPLGKWGEIVPPNMTNVSSSASAFGTFTKAILDIKDEVDDLVCFGAVFRYNITNFRDSKEKKKGGLNSEDLITRIPAHLVGIGFLPASSKKGYFLPLRDRDAYHEEDEDNVPMEDRWEFFLKFLESPIKKLCFDAKSILKCAIKRDIRVRPSNLLDVKIGCWIYEPEISYDFDELIFHFLKEQKKTVHESNIQSFFKDLVNCFRLWTTVETLLTKEKLIQPFVEQEMKIVPILATMEIHGIGFDSNALQKNKKKLQQRLNELQERANQMAGHMVSLSSPSQVSKFLFEELKLVSPDKSAKSKTKSHQTTTEKVLKQIKELHPFPGIVLEFRHCNKLLTTWIDVLDKKAIPTQTWNRDADYELTRIHTTWQQTNTATGRLASTNPNLQNLPKMPMSVVLDEDSQSEKLTINVRDAFCSSPEHLLLAFDYSQMEMRILTHMSQDASLLQFFKDEQDIHRQVAGRWLGKKPEEVTSTEREHAKRIVYGILYGMGPASLGEQLGISVQEASKFIETFMQKFPGVAKFIKTTVANAKKEKFIKTLYNRRRLLPEIDNLNSGKRSRSERQAVNSIIQGTAADIVKLAMIEVDELLRNDKECEDCKLLLQIHDELMFEVPKERVKQVAKLIKKAMEKVVTLDVTIPVTVQYGERWGSLKKLDLEENVSNNHAVKGLFDDSQSSQSKSSQQQKSKKLQDKQQSKEKLQSKQQSFKGPKTKTISSTPIELSSDEEIMQSQGVLEDIDALVHMAQQDEE